MDSASMSRWSFGFVVSVLAHAAVLGLLITTNTSRQEPPMEPEPGERETSETTVETPTKPPVETPPAAMSVETKPTKPAETKPTKPVETSAAKPVRTVPHVVRNGETLTKIANDAGTTPEELAVLNNSTVKKLNRILVGQKILVPAAD